MFYMLIKESDVPNIREGLRTCGTTVRHNVINGIIMRAKVIPAFLHLLFIRQFLLPPA